MDQRHSHFLHHHQHNRTRYAPLPSHHHHHHLPPPPTHPPPPPPPPPPQHRCIHTPPPPPPPPQPYNPPPHHQSQFPFNPIEQERPISTNHPHNLHNYSYSHSPRLSNRIFSDNPLPRRDFDHSSWNPSPRVVSDNRNYHPSVDFDRELHHHRATVPPPPLQYQPIDDLRYDPEGGSSRLRMEHLDNYEENPRERGDFAWGRGSDGNYHRRDFGVDVDSKPGGYVHVYSVGCEGEVSRGSSRRESRDAHGENKRWINDRKGNRELHDSSFEFGKNEVAAAAGNGNDFRIVSGKRDYYGSELNRYNGRGNNRECGHEFTRTPPHKQIQKKSALLRIQTVKPNHRNRENEQSRYNGYAADSNSNFFRGKEQHGYQGHGMKAEEREGSPVELDISFESNSLVAKAIVAPSSLAVVCDTNTIPVSDTDLCSAEKRKKVSVSDSDCSGLQPAKLSTGAVSLNSSPCKANDTSSSGKDLSLQKNVSDTCSPPCTSVTNKPHGKNEVALSNEITNICSGKSSARVVKKKKIVKRVVKKVVVNPNSTVSNSLSANMLPGTVQTDSVTLESSNSSGPDKIETSLKEKSTTVDKVSMTDCLHSLPQEGNVLPEDKKEDLSLPSLGLHSRSQECKTGEDSDSGKLARFERGGNISNSPSCVSSSIEDKHSDSDCLDANNSVHDLLSMPNTDEVTKSLNGSTFSEINDMVYDNKQLCQNEVSLSLGNYSNVVCPQNRHLVDVGDEMNCRLFSSTDNTVNTVLKNTCSSANDSIYGLNSNDLTGSEENFTVSDSGNDGTVAKADCENEAPTSTQYAILEENLDTDIPVSSSGMVTFSSSGKTRIEEGSDCIQHVSVLKQLSENGSANSEECITVHCCDTGKQVSPSDATISPENCDTEKTWSNFNISVGFDEGNTNEIKEREVMTHLYFLSSKMEGISPDPVNPVSHANDVDRASSMLKDPCLSDVLDQSVQSLDFNSQSSVDEVTALHGKIKVSEAEFHVGNNGNEDVNKVSPVSKRKKVTASHPNFTQCQSEFSDAIAVTTSCAEVPISFSDNQAFQKEGVLSSMCINQSMPYSEDIAKLSDNVLAGGSFKSIDANRETMSSDDLELQHSDIASYSPSEDLAIPNVQFSMLQGEQKENNNPIVPISSTQTDILVIGNIKGEKTNLQAVEESYQYLRSPSADMESNDLNMKDDLLPQQGLMSPADGDGVATSNSDDEFIEDASDALSNMCSKGMMSEVPDRRILNCTASSQVYSKGTTQGLNSSGSELNGSKNEPGGVIARTFQGHSFTFSKSKSKTKTSASSTHISKPRTWHRAFNTSLASLPGIKPSVGTIPPKKPILERKGNNDTFYIRKGNSLVRKPTPVSALCQISSADQSPSFGLDELPKNTRSEGRVDVTEPMLKTGVTNAPQQRQRTPPGPTDTRSEENISSPLVEPPSSVCFENVSYPRKFIENNDAPNSSEDAIKRYEITDNQSGPSNNGVSQVEANDENISTVSTKRIVYIKPKTNQLVATSNSHDVSVSTDDKAQTAFSDGYYKRSKNQLVRTTFESHIKQTGLIPNSTVNSDRQGACKVLCNRRFSKRRSHKVGGSSCKPLRASLVWTLRGKSSSKSYSDSRHYQKVLPHLFPWKRATYLRSFIYNYASSSNHSSLSAISKKLLLLRKRDTVYTRSTHGFSLWKSKVLGVGGSSLKWSKSIEKHSKQANEEATLAVAAVERKKREQEDAAHVGSQAKRERIFRIGSVRYRMDPSRRTLQRISDDESLSSASSIHPGLTAKRVYIPRRLVIGNDEYVQIGNGNQLIRDPKKRTRKLANEKVRWSLHTARQRLARRQKYCQFFTRFGKCNKDGGKCPYIHDPSKIAVCTKFLNGLCSTPNCKLTHEVIPERMPDCSYFLQGLCTNRDCPYRHVNVNPKAAICEGFLKGYCADGNECRKKHSYVCPTFEASGTCTQGTKCKLHHPKRQSKGKKRKRSVDQNSRGRYFGSTANDVSEPGMIVSRRQRQRPPDDDFEELPGYIGLDDDDVDVEVAESVDQSFEQATLCDSDCLDLQLDNFDELIKPVLIMKSKFTSQSPQSSSLQA